MSRGNLFDCSSMPLCVRQQSTQRELLVSAWSEFGSCLRPERDAKSSVKYLAVSADAAVIERAMLERYKNAARLSRCGNFPRQILDSCRE
jgi:hypothetical protein